MRIRDMMRRKKLASVLVAIFMVFSMTACGNSEVTESVSDVPEETVTGESEAEVNKESVEVQKLEFDRADENTVSEYDAVRTDYTLNIDASMQMHDISDMLMGIFIEDINFAADGGLYAEKIVNRSFEFTEIAKGDQMYGWQTVGNVEASVVMDDVEGALNENNTNYLVMNNATGALAGVVNVGFLDGISIEEGKSYDFSIWAKAPAEYKGALTIRLMVGDEVAGESVISGLTKEWAKYETTLDCSMTANKNVKLQVLMEDGSVAIDMVSLFPQDTYKNRENGLRNDLAIMLEELEPSFLRFPGGCVIEGYDYETMYNWKDSIGVGRDGEPLLFNNTYGDVAARKQGTNIWTNIRLKDDPLPSYMTYGLGFYEYFLLAEDIGAIGVPVLNCGLYCQVRGGEAVPVGSDEFQRFIQDALDLVEFCRGGADTKWGAVRIAMGHEEPFELKYIGIGNENWGNQYYLRYSLFVEAFEKAAKESPELFEGIELMYSAGTDDATSGADNYKSYQYAEEWLEEHEDKTILDFAGATDHHYYNTPEWFLQNTDYYDEENYSRESLTETVYGGGINVFVGEYAAKSNTLKAALAEAAYMTGIERNGDIIKMAAYAPLFGNLTAMHWAPDLIWFDNHQCTGSINYYMQKLFSTNVGTAVLDTEFVGAEATLEAPKGMIGVGTWNTTAKFDNVKIVSNETGEVLGEQTFDTDTFRTEWDDVADGDFSVEDGQLVQWSNSTSATTTGTVAYYGKTDWSNYTYTVEATKIDGAEGFLIPFVVQGEDDHYFWNIGGWNNTVSCLQQVSSGAKSDQVAGTVKNCKIKAGQTYVLKVVVTDTNVKCYIDDKLYVDYDFATSAGYEAYQVVSTDENGDIIIKLVNVTDEDRTFAITIEGAGKVKPEAAVNQVKGESLTDDNVLGEKEDCIMEEFTVDGISEQFNYTVPQYSATVIRVEMNINKTYEVKREELIIKENDKEIYGKIYMPADEGVYPAVILSHGYNGCNADFIKECNYFAKNGFIAYAFDFSGGSGRSKSKGSSTDMTIFTEKEDLLTVFHYIKGLDFVDKENIYLFGGSQGGLVTALVAEECKDNIKGMALYFPAFNIPDDWRRNYASENDIPEIVDFWGLKLGREFFVSMREFYTFDNIGAFDEAVLIVHGDKDAIVPMRYAEKATEIYHDAKLVVLPGEGHGFTPQGGDKAMKLVLEFMREGSTNIP